MNMDVLYAIGSIILTAFMYMILPAFYFPSKIKSFSKSKIKKMLIINSIVVCLIASFLGYIFYPEDYLMNPAPALIYYGLNYWIWIKKGNNSIDFKKNKTNNKRIKSKPKTKNKQNNKKVGYILCIIGIIILITIIIILLIILHNRNIYIEQIEEDKNNYIQKYVRKKTELEETEHELYILLNGHTKSYVQNKMNFIDENIVFVIDGYGNYYSNYDCMIQRVGNNAFTYWAYNKEAAISRGYKKYNCE